MPASAQPRAHCVSKAVGIPLGGELTGPAIAAVLGDAGLWTVPAAARLVACVNKVDSPAASAETEQWRQQRTAAESVAELAVEAGAAVGLVTGEAAGGGGRGTVVAAVRRGVPE
eukprot:SAG22_NODE_2484_length_2524_cov_14.986804_2_plen_114_part_00